jgi:hypothetical protein
LYTVQGVLEEMMERLEQLLVLIFPLRYPAVMKLNSSRKVRQRMVDMGQNCRRQSATMMSSTVIALCIYSHFLPTEEELV